MAVANYAHAAASTVESICVCALVESIGMCHARPTEERPAPCVCAQCVCEARVCVCLCGV